MTCTAERAAAAGASTPIVQLIAACILALVVYLATLESVTREISVGSFVSFIAAMMLLMQPLKHLTNINGPLQQGIAAGQSIFFARPGTWAEIAY